MRGLVGISRSYPATGTPPVFEKLPSWNAMYGYLCEYIQRAGGRGMGWDPRKPVIDQGCRDA